MISALKKHTVFVAIFGSVKSLVYVTPLLLADVLSTSDFGILEYALAGLGVIVNTIINLGVPGAYPYFVLKNKREDLVFGFHLHPIILLIPFLINQILYLLFNLDINFYLAFNISFIIANQVFYSVQLKSHEKSSLAVVLDSGIYLLLFLYFLGYKVHLFEASINSISLFVLVYALIYTFLGISRFLKNTRDNVIKVYTKILSFSTHLLISTFLIFLITTSGRILVEFFFDFKAVGVYAFYFRLSAVVVMIHQVINIAYFKKIYTYEPNVLDKYYYKFFIVISLLSMTAFFLAPYLLSKVSTFFNNTFHTNRDIYFLLSAQMTMWIATALNSNIIDRENLAKLNNLKFLVLLLIFALSLYLLKEEIDMSLLVYCHFSMIFIACIIQYFSLYRKQIFFFKSAITLTLVYIVLSMFYFLAL